MKLIAIGSNIDPDLHVPQAVKRISHRMPILKASPFTMTAPIDRPEQDDYWNGVIAVEWDKDRTELELLLLHLEQLAGRIRSEDAYAARTLDLDIVWWNDWMDDDVIQRAFLQQAVLDVAPHAVMPNGRKLANVTVLAHPAGDVVWQPKQP